MINRDQDRFKLKPINDKNKEAITFEEIQKQQQSVVIMASTVISQDKLETLLSGTNQNYQMVKNHSRTPSQAAIGLQGGGGGCSDEEDEMKKRKTQETLSSMNNPGERDTMIQQQQQEHQGDEQKKLENIQVTLNTNVERVTRDCFETITKLGDGSYGKVYLVRKKNTLKQYALKCLDKIHIIKHDKVESVHRERDILMIAKHPNIVHLECTFSDDNNLYFLLEYVQNKSLSELLKQIKPLPIDLVRFYTAEIVSALEFLHSKGIAHRDLKPENIMIDSKYHLKITDFGDSKLFKIEEVQKEAQHFARQLTVDFDEEPCEAKLNRGTFVGTPLYVSPEMLDCNQSGPYTDLWALGCIVYQMLTGDVPFLAHYDFQVFQMITERKLIFPKYLPIDAVDLVDKLMNLNPSQRLGAGLPGTDTDYEHLKSHPFFKAINFKKLQNNSPPIPAERFKSAFSISHNFSQKRERSSKCVLGTEPDQLVDLQVNDSESMRELSDLYSPQKSPHKTSDFDQRHDFKALLKQEKEQMLIKSGIVYKKKGVVSNLKRKLILTNQPRLFYTTDDGEYKADILITPSLKASCYTADKFEITCKRSGKHLIFRVVGEDAQIWTTKINRVIEAHTK